jgi:hypothetical protein
MNSSSSSSSSSDDIHEPPPPPPPTAAPGGMEDIDSAPKQQQEQRQRRRYKYIPEPTWSIQDLDLFTNQPPLPPEELERLSRLALIDISNKSTNERAQLNQDLANMLHMIQQVTECNLNDANNKDINNELDNASAASSRRAEWDVDGASLCSSEIYDFVRGVSAAPLRKGTDEDPLHQEDAKEAQEVWENLLQPKTIRKGGGHQYFTIVTEEAKSTK